MTFIDAIRSCLRQYATFRGRARRGEFWWWVLATSLGSLVANGLDRIFFMDQVLSSRDAGPISNVFGLLILLPTLAVAARRLHDTDNSGWWQLVCLIPLVGWFVMLAWAVTDSQRGTNRFGRDPKALPQPDGVQDYVPPRADSAR